MNTGERRNRNRNRRNNRHQNHSNNAPTTYRPVIVPHGCSIVDSHMHLHYLYDLYPEYSSPEALRHLLAGDEDSYDADADLFAWHACIEYLISSYCDPAAFSPSFRTWPMDLQSTGDFVYGCFGCHPHHAKSYSDEMEQRIIEALTESGKKGVAWGEIGLDFGRRLQSPKAKQIEVFRRQLSLAVPMGFPLCLHIAGGPEVEQETLDALREYAAAETRIHFHCFRGSIEFAKTIMAEFSSYLGFTCLVLGGERRLEDVIREVPLDRLLLETDSPYMAPPHRQSRNSRSGSRSISGSGQLMLKTASYPGDLVLIADRIAQIKGVELKVVLDQIRENTRQMYGI